MTPAPIQAFWLDHHTHLALVEYAWLHRTTMGDVVRAVLDSIANGVDDSVLAVEDRPGRRRVSLRTTDEQWNSAKDVASSLGVGFHSLIRRHIIKALMEEGLLE